MAVMEKPVTTGINNGGYTELGNGLAMYVGIGYFTTTGTSVSIKHPFGTGQLFSAQATPLFATAAAVANGQLSIGGATLDSTYGTFKSSTSGALTVLRAAGTDSALTFSILIVGRARK